MSTKKDKEMSSEKTSTKKEDADELKQFILKKKNQNVALKNFITKLNMNENKTTNK